MPAAATLSPSRPRRYSPVVLPQLESVHEWLFGNDSRNYLQWGLKDKRQDVLMKVTAVGAWSRWEAPEPCRPRATPTDVLSFQLRDSRGALLTALLAGERVQPLYKVLRQACQNRESEEMWEGTGGFCPSPAFRIASGTLCRLLPSVYWP